MVYFCYDIILFSNFSDGLFIDMLTELARREKAANIKPDPDLDVYMKVSLRRCFVTLSYLWFAEYRIFRYNIRVVSE